MGTSHEIPERVGRLRTTARFGREIKRGEGLAPLNTVGTVTLWSETSDGEHPVDGKIGIGISGQTFLVSVVDAAALVVGLVEHLSARQDLVAGNPAQEWGRGVLAHVAASIIENEQIPEDHLEGESD